MACGQCKAKKIWCKRTIIKKCLGLHYYEVITFDSDCAPRNMVLDLKINWDHFHHMTHEGLGSQSLFKLDVFVFRLIKLWLSNRNGLCYMLTTLFWTFTCYITYFSILQTKIICMLCLFFNFVKGLNHVSSICMGSSISEVANNWGWYRKCKISLGQW
jgi:hypothetical protein